MNKSIFHHFSLKFVTIKKLYMTNDGCEFLLVEDYLSTTLAEQFLGDV